MSYILVRHQVSDYAKWRTVFDEHESTRKAAGSKAGHVLRSANNPNELSILLEWDSHERARQFAESDDLRNIMESAGVVGRPDIYYLDSAGTTTA